MIAKTALIIFVVLSLIAISLSFCILAFVSWPNGKLTLIFIACDAIFSFFAFKVIKALAGE